MTVDRWLSTVNKSRTCGQMAWAAGGQRVGKQVLGWADEQASGPLTARLARSPRRYQWQAASFCVMPIAGRFQHSGGLETQESDAIMKNESAAAGDRNSNIITQQEIL